MKRAVALALALSTLLGAAVANACAVCGCGDPTLTVLGSEPPGDLRARGAIELRHRTDRVGVPGVDELRLSEQRLDSTLAVSPHRSFFVLATLPVLRREVRYPNLAVRGGYSIGDAEVRVKAFAFRDRAFAPRHVVAIIAGAKLPTAPRQYDPDGEPLAPELQPGTGSLDPIFGLSYTFSRYPWSLYASAQALVPTRTIDGFRASASLRQTFVVQRHFGAQLAVRTGLDTRMDTRAMESGARERDSGGLVGFALVELVSAVHDDLMILASLRYPVVQRLYGAHREGPIVSVGVAYDL